MSKVRNTYWDNSSFSSTRQGGKTNRDRGKTPQWFIFAAIVSITFLLCLAINFRAFSELRQENIENTALNAEIEKLTSETSVLQGEIKDLKDDPHTIAREARKLGMSRPNEKILVPVN